MNWKSLLDSDQIDQIKEYSVEKPVLIFKHSTSCSISDMALNRLNRSWDENETNNIYTYLLDLLQFRPISNQLAEVFSVSHESPQVLVISKGECVYHNSHMGIVYEDIKEIVTKIN